MAGDVDLGPELDAFLETLVKVGRFSSRSEAVREGIRLLKEREAPFAALDAAIARGLADSEAGRVHTVAEVREHLRGRARERPKRKRA